MKYIGRRERNQIGKLICGFMPGRDVRVAMMERGWLKDLDRGNHGQFGW